MKEFHYNRPRFAKFARTAVLAGTSVCVGLGVYSPAHGFTLEEAVRAAIQTNPTVGEAIERRRASQYGTAAIKGRFLPQISVTTNTGYQWNDSGSSAGQTRISRGVNVGVSVTGTQILYDGGATRSAVAQSDAQFRASSERVYEQAEAIGLQAGQAYLQVLQERELTSLAEASVRRHEEILRLVERRVEGELATRADIQTSLFRLAAAQNQLTQAQSRLRDSRAIYKRIIGTLPGTMSRPVVPRHLIPKTLQAAVNQGIQNSPTIAAGRQDVEASRRAVDIERAKHSPKVDLRVTSGVARNQSSRPVATAVDASATVTISYPLYDGNQARNDSLQASANLAGERQSYNSSVRGLEEQVRRSWAALISARESLQTQRRETQAYEQVRNIYRQQFEAGTQTLIDVLQAENQLHQSQVNLISSVYGEIFGTYRLLSTTGNLLTALNVLDPNVNFTNIENADATALPQTNARVPTVNLGRGDLPPSQSALQAPPAQQFSSAYFPSIVPTQFANNAYRHLQSDVFAPPAVGVNALNSTSDLGAFPQNSSAYNLNTGVNGGNFTYPLPPSGVQPSAPNYGSLSVSDINASPQSNL
ncbi:MAG: TolC family outer membrane protein [Pseudomonadota bacterium]